MAITKTATRDLTTAIAGEIWNRINDADNRRLEEEAGVDPAVKKARKDLDREDPEETKVYDKDLRGLISKVFGRLDVQISQTDGKVDSLSNKVSAVGGEVVNTQQMIINQNEMLEAKFDQLLGLLTGNRKDAEQKDDDDEFQQLELDLEQKKEGGSASTRRVSSKGKSGGRSYTGLVNWFRARFGEWFSKRLRGIWKARWFRNLTKKPRAAIRSIRNRIEKKIFRVMSESAGKNVLPKLLKGPGAKKAISIALGRGAGRMIPVASSALAADDVARYTKKGDWLGMALATIDMVASGTEAAYGTGVGAPVGAAASLIANIAGWGLTAYEIGQILLGGDPFSTKGILPFETGTKMQPSASMVTIPALVPIVSVTRAFGKQSGFGKQVDGVIAAAGVSDIPEVNVSYPFTVGGGVTGGGLVESTTPIAAPPDIIEPSKREEEPVTDETESSDDNKGGTGGDKIVPSETIMGGKGSVIEFHGQQGVDRSGEPGVDFSFRDYKSNYSLFPGRVLETGLLYGTRYGNVVVVRSTDPSNGKEFDALYSHFPDGGIAVSAGDKVGAGQYLGKVGFVSVDVPGVPNLQPRNAGNMSGWHTSVDFFEPGSAERYSNTTKLINLVIGASGRTPHGLLEKLKPTTKPTDSSSSSYEVPDLPPISGLNSIESPIPNIVSEGSMNRQLIAKGGKRSSIVIINNQIIKTSNLTVPVGSGAPSDKFFEAYNLARLG